MTPAQLKFLKECETNAYFSEHSKVLIALSGGQDSMTLFNWLYDLKENLQIELGIAHINHGQRKVSNFEEEKLRELAKDKEVSIYVDKFTGGFTEKKAREFRYHFFEKIMIENGYTAIVTAHHKGDVIETVLMREITGRPLRSLQGIAERQPFASGELIRPLLSFVKSELDAPYFFEDQTNQGTAYFRNRVRNQLIPELTKENPRFSEAMMDLTDEIKQAMCVISDKISELDILGKKITIKQFLSQSEALQHFILQAYFAQFPEVKISKKKFSELLHIINRPQQYHEPLNKDFDFIKTDVQFYIEKKQVNLEKELIILTENPGDESFMEIYLPEKGEIEIRKRQPGDKILINGHHKKLRKFFIDNHIPLEKRENSLIFVEKRLYAIVGVVCSDLSKAAKNGKIKRILWVKPSIREEIHHA